MVNIININIQSFISIGNKDSLNLTKKNIYNLIDFTIL